MITQSYCRLIHARRMIKLYGTRYINISQIVKSITSSCCTHQFDINSSPSYSQTREYHIFQRCNFRVKLTSQIGTSHAASEHTSSLYVSDASNLNSAPVELDLNIGKRIARKERLKRNLKIRQMTFDVDTFVEDYNLFKRLENEKRRLEKGRENVAKQMADLKRTKSKDEEQKKSLVQRGKQIKEALKELQMSYWLWEERVTKAALKLPNDLRSQTPEEEEHIVDTHREMPDISEARCHLELVREENLVKFSSGGIGAYYLKGDLATAESALVQFVTNHLSANNFHRLSCPEIFRSLVVEGCGYDYKNKHKVFSLEVKEEKDGSKLDDFMHVTGVSPMSFTAYLAKTVVQTSNLPYRMFTTGRQYQADIEADMSGLYGASQSVKTGIMSSCSDRVSCAREFNKMAATVWSMYNQFDLHMRLVVVAGQELRQCESMRVDIQTWAPSLKKYVRIGHIACLDDFVSRRLMCYHSNNMTDYQTFNHLHMVYGEVLDVTRLLAVLVECDVVKQMIPILLDTSELTAPQHAQGGSGVESLLEFPDLVTS